MNPRLLGMMLVAGLAPGDAVTFDEPPPEPHTPLPEVVRLGSSKGKAAPEPTRRMSATGASPVMAMALGTEPRRTRAERRKGMARTSPAVLAVRERRRRQRRARAAGRGR